MMCKIRKIQQKRNPKRVKVRKTTDNFLTLERAKKEYGDEYIVTEEEMFGRKCICLMPKDETRAAWENKSKSCCDCHCENGTTATNPKQETDDISYDSLKRIVREYYLPTPVDENSGLNFVIEENCEQKNSYILTAKINKEKGTIAVFRYYADGSVGEILDPTTIAKTAQTLYIMFMEQKHMVDKEVKDAFDRETKNFYQKLYSGAYSILEASLNDVKYNVTVGIKDNGTNVCTVTFYEDGSYRIAG